MVAQPMVPSLAVSEKLASLTGWRNHLRWTPMMGRPSQTSTSRTRRIRETRIPHVRGDVKCKLFITTFRQGVMTWFKNLRRNSIDSWDDLCHEFTAHFTASRTQSKTVASLEAISQGKSELLNDYIERFNKEDVPV